MKIFLRSMTLLAALLLLSSCYLPTGYDLKIQILKDGRFAYEYEGDLIHLGFLQDIGWKKMLESGVEPSEQVREIWDARNVDEDDILAFDEQEKVGVYERDLKRDRGFSEVRYKGQARYAVKYRFQGDINERRSFFFVRRNAWFMRIARSAPGVVELTSNKLPSDYRQELMAGGFDAWGTVRVWTDAQVEFHNATSVQEGSPALYTWEINSMEEPAPRMVIAVTPEP